LFWVATCFRANTVSIIVDETTDITGRYMSNIVVSTRTLPSRTPGLKPDSV
jgi:hypothetical protein